MVFCYHNCSNQTCPVDQLVYLTEPSTWVFSFKCSLAHFKAKKVKFSPILPELLTGSNSWYKAKATKDYENWVNQNCLYLNLSDQWRFVFLFSSQVCLTLSKSSSTIICSWIFKIIPLANFVFLTELSSVALFIGEKKKSQFHLGQTWPWLKAELSWVSSSLLQANKARKCWGSWLLLSVIWVLCS